MTLTGSVQSIAEHVARQAHAGQREEATGEPYTTHLERVVSMVEGDEAKAVAWLHDVLEDTPRTIFDLQAAGVSEPVLQAVLLLTRGSETYAEYIETLRVTRNPLALAVKIADLQDHLREATADWLNDSRRRRYERALDRLNG